ncbi:MAG: LPS export ABC transporter periplasmic protein LptC [Burkholderiales bacterium]
MKSRLAQLLPVLVILLLAAMTLWLRFAVETPPRVDPGKNRHDPDSIAENVTIIRMTPSGNKQYELFATRMVHYPDNDSMELTAPRFHRTDANSDLTVTAGRGRVNQEAKEAFFQDNVELIRRPIAGKDSLNIKTQFMQVFMDREFARTDRDVVIVNGASTLTGTGMEYDKKTSRMTLLSAVKGSFHAPKN